MKGIKTIYIAICMIMFAACSTPIEVSGGKSNENVDANQAEAKARVDSIQQVKPAQNVEKKTHNILLGPKKKK
jgi:hypothetical protein